MSSWRRLTVAGLLLLQAGCTGLVRDDGVYAAKAGRTAEVVASSLQTARYAVQAAREGKAPGRYVVQLLDEAEEQAGSAQGTFDAIQPPGVRSDELRDELDPVLQDAVEALTELRIQARRGDTARLIEEAEPLPELAERLQRFAEAQP